MECPECKYMMVPICMYGDENNINTDWYCEECGTTATWSWKPSKKKRKAEDFDDEIPF